jgi:hypothetical protein
VLIDTQYLVNTKKLVVSYVDKTGEIKLKYYDWENPLKYVTCEETDPQRHPDYKSWDNKHVKQIDVNHPDRYAVYEFLDALPEKERDEIFEFNLPKIFFVDIETEIVDGFPEAADILNADGSVKKEGASTQVLSISVVYDDKIILLGLKDMPQDMQDRILTNTNKYFEKSKVEYKFKYIKYDDEFDMLYNFFYKMVPKMPLITGWNFLNYDWLYLVNRSRKLSKWVNNKQIKIDPAVSSFTKRLNKVWSTEYEVPAHRMIFDYMQLYEICDTSIKVKESSSLDFVSNKLVGVDKIKYTGSLQKLYEDDFETFMYYNAVDSVLVQKIHEARNYISIIFAISALAKIRVVDIVSQVGRSGKVTPVAIMKPVNVYGVIVTRATLHNQDEIARLNLKIGDTVIIRRAGDVIPEIVQVLPELRIGVETEYQYPENCPECNTPLIQQENQVNRYCPNRKCPARNIGYLSYAVSAEGFHIVGLSEKLLIRLQEAGLLQHINDIFTLTLDDIRVTAGFGEKSAHNLFTSIQNAKHISFRRFIQALGIPMVGSQTALQLSRTFKSLDDLLITTIEELQNIPDIGDKVSQSIIEFFHNTHNIDIISRLIKSGIHIEYEIGKRGKWNDKIICITGIFATISRKELQSIIEEQGGIVASQISSKTDMLIVGLDAGSKLSKAKKLGIAIITEKELQDNDIIK